MLPILADAGIEPSISIIVGYVIVVITMFSFLFFVRRLKHKEIMAAIEKGVSLPELGKTRPRSPRWITNISAGIGFLIVSLLLLTEFLYDLIRRNDFGYSVLLFFGVLFAIGVVFLVRGLLQRKIQQ
jgi:hypothetical protein